VFDEEVALENSERLSEPNLKTELDDQSSRPQAERNLGANLMQTESELLAKQEANNQRNFSSRRMLCHSFRNLIFRKRTN